MSGKLIFIPLDGSGVKAFFASLICCLFLNPFVAAAATSLCTPDETVVWSCNTEKRTISVCASKHLTGSEGYMQYRVGKEDKLEMTFPQRKQHPKGLFRSELLARAAVLSFRKGNYTYEITDPLTGEASVRISKNDKVIATAECRESTHTLTETPMLDLMKSIGIRD